MNIENIKEIIDNPTYSYEIKQKEILWELAKSEDVFIYLMKIIEYERIRKKNCMFEMQNIISDVDIIHNWKSHNRWNWWMKWVLSRIEPLFRNWKWIIWHQTKWNYDEK